MTEDEFWTGFRQALLLLIDFIERWRWPRRPRTAELRKERKQQSKEEC